jgi:predicted transcriptional regulator of viral defense system
MILVCSCVSIHHANAHETGSPHLQRAPWNAANCRGATGWHSSAHARGEIEQIARGLFRLAELPSPGEPDLLTVAKKVPHAVFCLLTALAFHRLTTQVPHAVEVALPRTARVPRLDHPPIKVFRFSSESLNVGIETHTLDGASIRVYCREKTLADAFKYRNKVGLDVALETLRAYRSQPKRDFQAVLKYARICRVENVIRPYLEATL